MTSDERMTWGLIAEVLGVLERHGYHQHAQGLGLINGQVIKPARSAALTGQRTVEPCVPGTPHEPCRRHMAAPDL
jgi:hypothetical protein